MRPWKTRHQQATPAAWLFGILAFAACANPASNQAAPIPHRAAELFVVNRYNSPMKVFAVGAGTTRMMGTVLPGFSARFAIGPGLLISGPVEFVAEPSTRNGAVRSDRLLIGPGDVVDFEIGIDLLNTTATVRPRRPTTG